MKCKFGIKGKILFVLVAVLALTSALHALLVSYFTNRQNQESAFAMLNRDLTAWQTDLQDLTLQLRQAATATVSDRVLLNQMAELVALEFDLDDPASVKEFTESARTLAYLKSVSISRLELPVRTSGFSSIAVYTSGKLSHYLSASEAGMTVRRGKADEVWASASADANGNLPLQRWPAWPAGKPDPDIPLSISEPKETTVSFDFPAPDSTILRIAVPVQGVFEAVVTDSEALPKGRLVSEVSIAAPTVPRWDNPSSRQPAVFAVVVFSRVMDHAVLEQVASKTGKWPALFSPDGRHQQQLTNVNLVSQELLQEVGALRAGRSVQGLQRIVTTPQGSFYMALKALQFENQPRLILVLASSRNSTLQNIRQTVTGILSIAALVLLLSLGMGVFLVSRLINPILALTSAVKDISLKSRLGSEARPASQMAIRELRPVTIKAPDEVGDLAQAFNEMIGELRRSFGTLEQRVHERTAALEARTTQLEVANKELESFSYSVSHDLRAPLRSIDGFSQVLLEDYSEKLDEEGKHYLHRVRAAAQRMGQLIDDILSLSRVTRGEMPMEKVSLSSLAQEIAAELARREPKRKVILRIAPDVVVTGNTRFLRAALENLLSNAWKFTSKRGEAEIEFGVTQQDGQPVYFVRDNGAGFNMDYAGRLFGAFQRLHSPVEFPGTGVGLATVQRILHRHGGRVWAEGEVDRGATFYFLLPQPIQRGESPSAL